MRNLLTCGTGYVAAGWLAAACMCLAAGQPGAVAAGPLPDDDVKVEVQYDRTGGAGGPSNLVIEPPQVYFELHACN